MGRLTPGRILGLFIFQMPRVKNLASIKARDQKARELKANYEGLAHTFSPRRRLMSEERIEKMDKPEPTKQDEIQEAQTMMNLTAVAKTPGSRKWPILSETRGAVEHDIYDNGVKKGTDYFPDDQAYSDAACDNYLLMCAKVPHADHALILPVRIIRTLQHWDTIDPGWKRDVIRQVIEFMKEKKMKVPKIILGIIFEGGYDDEVGHIMTVYVHVDSGDVMVIDRMRNHVTEGTGFLASDLVRGFNALFETPQIREYTKKDLKFQLFNCNDTSSPAWKKWDELNRAAKQKGGTMGCALWAFHTVRWLMNNVPLHLLTPKNVGVFRHTVNEELKRGCLIDYKRLIVNDFTTVKGENLFYQQRKQREAAIRKQRLKERREELKWRNEHPDPRLTNVEAAMKRARTMPVIIDVEDKTPQNLPKASTGPKVKIEMLDPEEREKMYEKNKPKIGDNKVVKEVLDEIVNKVEKKAKKAADKEVVKEVMDEIVNGVEKEAKKFDKKPAPIVDKMEKEIANNEPIRNDPLLSRYYNDWEELMKRKPPDDAEPPMYVNGRYNINYKRYRDRMRKRAERAGRVPKKPVKLDIIRKDALGKDTADFKRMAERLRKRVQRAKKRYGPLLKDIKIYFLFGLL